MSIPDVDVPIGFLYETTLMKYASGKLTDKDGIIMSPEDALQHFKDLAVEEGFAEDTIENSAEELLYDLEDIEERKYQEYLEEKE
jgi:hypothetical protein